MKNTYPIQPGIGWQKDLEVVLHKQPINLWFPQIKSGWYYLNGMEDYLFSKESNSTVIVTGGLSIFNNFENLKIASQRGPIILDGEDFRYTRVTSNMAVFRPMSPIPYGEHFLYIEVPGEVVLVTDQSGMDLVSVPSTGDLYEKTYYYWDFINRYIWIKRDPSDPTRTSNLYITYLKDSPDLLQEEILIVGSDGNLRTMLGRVYGWGIYPKLTVAGLGVVAVSDIQDNVITPSTQLKEGTRVGIAYYVDGSFCLAETSTGTALSIFRSVSEVVNIRWEEGGYDGYLDIGKYRPTEASFVQVNPLFTGVEPGFLYLGNPRYPEEDLARISIKASPTNLCGDNREPVRILVSTYSKNNTPLPRIDLDVWLYNSNNGIRVPFPLDYDAFCGGKTNLAGTRAYIWESSPESIGSWTICASSLAASGEVVYAEYPIVVSKNLLLTDLINSYKVTLYLSKYYLEDGTKNLYCYITNQLGIPVPTNLKVSISCEKGFLYHSSTIHSSGNFSGQKSIEVGIQKSELNIGVCKYLPVVGDRIIARPLSNRDSSDQSEWEEIAYSFESVPLEVRDE